MKSVKKLALALVLASSVFGTAGAASATHGTRDLCAGAVEADGCWYCAYASGFQGEPPTWCHEGYYGYTWEYCALWVADVCVEGAIKP